MFKKYVQSHFNRTKIVTRIGFQEAATGQRVNFSVMYVKRYAASPSRRRSRCRRMRSAAAERVAGAAIGGFVVISTAVQPNMFGAFGEA